MSDDMLDHFAKDGLPKVKGSALTVVITAEPDAKLCLLEVGAMVLLDKPIIVLCPPGRKVSSNLKRCASMIITGEIDDPAVQKKMQEAIDRILREDLRAQ